MTSGWIHDFSEPELTGASSWPFAWVVIVVMFQLLGFVDLFFTFTFTLNIQYRIQIFASTHLIFYLGGLYYVFLLSPSN